MPSLAVANFGVVDLVTHNPERNEYILIMVETRPWSRSLNQLGELQEKINTYFEFVDGGQMARSIQKGAPVVDRAEHQLHRHGPPDSFLICCRSAWAKRR